MHINIGDKLVAVKKLNGFFDIGDVINITEIENNVISFKYDNNLSKSGQMDFASCEKYFVKVEAEETTEEYPTVTEEWVREIMDNSEFEVLTTFDKCTIVSCRLPNGFVITESSSCVNPNDYDEELGTDICFDKIAKKIWELEAYRLQQLMYEDNIEDCDCCCGACCENCDDRSCIDEEEFDECLDTDLDCDDCEDFGCPYRVK